MRLRNVSVPLVRSHTTRIFGKTITTVRMIPKLPNAITRYALFLGVLLTAFLLAIGQDDPASSREASDLIDQAVERLQGYSTVKAKIRYSGRLYGHEIVGTGSYLQDGSGQSMKWQNEWNLQVGDRKSSRREVCNGDSLWVEARSDQVDIALSRVNLRKVRVEAQKRQAKSKNKRNSETTNDGNAASGSRNASEPIGSEPIGDVQPPVPLGGFPLGGFSGFLQSLRGQVRWTKVETSKLGKDRVWIIHGDMAQPPHSSELPNHVRVVLACDGEFQLFPFRIEWYQRTAKQTKRFLVVDYFAISANAPLSADEFEFDPGDRDYSDQTDGYLNRQGGMILP